MREPLRREGRQAQRAPNNCFMSGGLRVNGGENLTVIVKLLICPALVLAQRETANRVECTGSHCDAKCCRCFFRKRFCLVVRRKPLFVGQNSTTSKADIKIRVVFKLYLLKFLLKIIGSTFCCPFSGSSSGIYY